MKITSLFSIIFACFFCFAQDKVQTIAEGDDWVALDFDSMTQPGSILDFSVFTDKPAGKFGPLQIDEDGHFYFRDQPGKRVRFLGPNLCANYLPPDVQDRFVKQVSRLGYNVVRFHHFERGLQSWDNGSSLDFRPDRMDQLDSLFAKLKEAGIYITIDIYASRQFEPNDGITERDDGLPHNNQRYEMKTLCPVSETAMANWKGFARKLLTHVNPYTGMTWGEDPALVIVNLMNEDNLVGVWNSCQEYAPIYERKYAEYLAERNLDTPENLASRGGYFIEFLNKVQMDCISEQIRFLNEELHVQAQISDLNHLSTFTMIEPRAGLPLVDNHEYWDHPSFPEKFWDFPYRYNNESAIFHTAFSPRWMMPSRILGKPFVSTEFHFCYPNPYRMEGGVLMGAYASLQDWDGLFRFAWSHYYDTMPGDTPGCVPKHFDINNDPLGQLDERIIWLLFLRGDVAPATGTSYAFTASLDDVLTVPSPLDSKGDFTWDFTVLGLFKRIGSLPRNAWRDNTVNLAPVSNPDWKKQLDETAADALEKYAKEHSIVSSTGEISLNSDKRSCVITTPFSEAATFSENMKANYLTVTDSTRYCTVGLFAMDGEDIASSSSMLLFHIPNVLATDMQFRDKERHLLLGWGHTPLLVERASARIHINLPADDCTVTALKFDGSENGTIALEPVDDGSIVFTARTDAVPGAVMVYHIRRK